MFKTYINDILQRIRNLNLKIKYICMGILSSTMLFSNLSHAIVTSNSIDPEKIIGKWQCSDQMDYMDISLKETSKIEFEKSGAYQETSKLLATKAREKANYDIKLTAKWVLDQNTLTLDHYKATSFKVDNPALEQDLKMQDAINDPDPSQFQIAELNDDKLVYKMILFDQVMDQYQIECKRIN